MNVQRNGVGIVLPRHGQRCSAKRGHQPLEALLAGGIQQETSEADVVLYDQQDAITGPDCFAVVTVFVCQPIYSDVEFRRSAWANCGWSCCESRRHRCARWSLCRCSFAPEADGRGVGRRQIKMETASTPRDRRKLDFATQ